VEGRPVTMFARCTARGPGRVGHDVLCVRSGREEAITPTSIVNALPHARPRGPIDEASAKIDVVPACFPLFSPESAARAAKLVLERGFFGLEQEPAR